MIGITAVVSEWLSPNCWMQVGGQYLEHRCGVACPPLVGSTLVGSTEF